MTKKLDPEIKALRAIHRALVTIDPAARSRALRYLLAREYGVTQADICIHQTPHSGRGSA